MHFMGLSDPHFYVYRNFPDVIHELGSIHPMGLSDPYRNIGILLGLCTNWTKFTLWVSQTHMIVFCSTRIVVRKKLTLLFLYFWKSSHRTAKAPPPLLRGQPAPSRSSSSSHGPPPGMLLPPTVARSSTSSTGMPPNMVIPQPPHPRTRPIAGTTNVSYHAPADRTERSTKDPTPVPAHQVKIFPSPIFAVSVPYSIQIHWIRTDKLNEKKERLKKSLRSHGQRMSRRILKTRNYRHFRLSKNLGKAARCSTSG